MGENQILQSKRLMIQILFLITGELSVFLIYYAFSLWISGWWNAPTRGGSFVFGGLFLLTLALIYCAISVRTRNPFGRSLIQFGLRIGFNRIRTASVIATIFFGILWFASSIQNVPFLHELTPYKDILLFLTLLTGQIGLLPLFMGLSDPRFSQNPNQVDLKIPQLLTGLFFVLVVFKVLVISPLVHSLVFYFDSYQYWLMASHLFHGTFQISDFNHYPPLYPILISLSFLFNVERSLTTISIINALISSSSVFPIYLLTRKFFDKKISLAFTLLSAVFPFHLVYPSILASENLAYPLFFWAAYFSFTQPDDKRWTVIWDLLTGLSIGLLWLTRYQTLVLIPVFVLTWWLTSGSTSAGKSPLPDKKKIIRFVFVVAVIFAVYSPWALMGMYHGLTFNQIIGTQIYVDDVPVRRTLTDLVFWIGITLAYMGLLIAPVMTQIIQAGFYFKSVFQNNTLRRWVIFVSFMTLILFLTTANHAWRAGYNYPIPNRLLGRYMIYLSVLIWLTGLILYRDILRLSIKKQIIIGLVSFSLAVISYQVFYHPSWILPRNILYYFFIDGYLPSLIPQVFFIILLFTIALSIFWFSIHRPRMGSYFLVGCLTLLFLSSFPAYIQKIAEQGLTGSHLDELLQYFKTSPVLESLSNKKVIWFNPEDGFYLDRELTVRGKSASEFLDKRLNGNPASTYKCKTRLMAQISNGRRFAVIEKNESCSFPMDKWITHYRVNQIEYLLVEFPQGV